MRRDGRCKTAPYSSHPPAGEANLGSRGAASSTVAESGRCLRQVAQLLHLACASQSRRRGEAGFRPEWFAISRASALHYRGGCREGVGWGRHPIDLTQFFGRKGVFKVGGGAFPVGHDGRLFGSREGAQSRTVASVVDRRDGREFESALLRMNEREAYIADLKLRCSFVQPAMSARDASGDGGCGCRTTAAQHNVDLCSEPAPAE